MADKWWQGLGQVTAEPRQATDICWQCGHVRDPLHTESGCQAGLGRNGTQCYCTQRRGGAEFVSAITAGASLAHLNGRKP